MHIYKHDFCFTVHHQLGKVIQKNQLDATMIYWSIISAQPISGNLLPIIRSVRLRFLQHMVSCWCGGQGDGERQRGTMCTHAQKPDFVFRRNGRVHLNQRGRKFSRLLAAEVCASAVVMLDTPRSEVVWTVLATHSIRQYPLRFPSRASPCAITFQLDSTCDGNDTLVEVRLFVTETEYRRDWCNLLWGTSALWGLKTGT